MATATALKMKVEDNLCSLRSHKLKTLLLLLLLAKKKVKIVERETTGFQMTKTMIMMSRESLWHCKMSRRILRSIARIVLRQCSRRGNWWCLE